MNKTVLVLLATNVGLAGASWQVVRELHAERESARALQVRVAQLERAAQQSATVYPLLPDEARARKTLDAAADVAAPAPEKPGPTRSIAKPALAQAAADPLDERTSRMRRSMERQRALLRDPEYLEALRTQQRAMLPAMYPDLAAELGLTPDEMDRFMTLLAEHQVRSMEAHSARFEEGSDKANVELIRRNAEAQRKAFDQEIRDLLGDEKWHAWRDYQSSLGARHEVAQLDTMLAGKGSALREDQIKPLRQALAGAQQETMRDWARSAAPDPVEAASVAQFDTQLSRMRAHNDRLREAVSSVLTPSQLQYFIEHQDAQMTLQEAQLRLMRAQAELQEAGATPHL